MSKTQKQGRQKNNPLPNTAIAFVMGTGAPRLADITYYKRIRDCCQNRGYDINVIALPQLGLVSPELSADQVADNIFSRSAKHWILMGHSQGGLLAEILALRYSHLVSGVVPVAEPHYGTKWANLWPSSIFLPAIRMMGADSEYLHDLRLQRRFDSDRIRGICTVTDGVIRPWYAARVSGAHNDVIAPAWMHALLRSRGVRRSNQAELVSGLVDHVSIIWSSVLQQRLNAALDHFELLPVAA